MSNGDVLADTNSLVYAYQAGGPKLIDTYLDAADEQDRKFAITRTVFDEIKDGPLKAELGQYIADRNIPVLSAPDTEQRLRAGRRSLEEKFGTPTNQPDSPIAGARDRGACASAIRMVRDRRGRSSRPALHRNAPFGCRTTCTGRRGRPSASRSLP
jgi:hypothetical protein